MAGHNKAGQYLDKLPDGPSQGPEQAVHGQRSRCQRPESIDQTAPEMIPGAVVRALTAKATP